MKKILLTSVLVFSLASVAAFAEPVRDAKGLERAHKHLHQAIDEMAKARAANNYDMAGHGAKAEEYMKDAEAELHASIEAAQAAK